MSLSPSVIRARVAAQILSDLPAYSESRWSVDLFGSDAQHVLHHSYAVGLGSSKVLQSSRNRRHSGALSMTQLVVRFAHRVRADAQVSDYDSAITAELAIIAAVLSTSLVGMSSLELSSVQSRTVVPSGDWFLGSVLFDVQHLFPTS